MKSPSITEPNSIPEFNQAQIEFIQNLVINYKEDKQNIDAMEYSGQPVFTALHMDLKAYDAHIDVLNYLLSLIEMKNSLIQIARDNNLDLDKQEDVYKASVILGNNSPI